MPRANPTRRHRPFIVGDRVWSERDSNCAHSGADGAASCEADGSSRGANDRSDICTGSGAYFCTGGGAYRRSRC